MIKFLPEIYPDEAVYSYLSRCYAYSGYMWNQGCISLILSSNLTVQTLLENVLDTKPYSTYVINVQHNLLIPTSE